MSRTPGSGRGTPISSRATDGASSSGSAQPETESGYDDRGSGAPEQVPAPSQRRRIAPRSNTSMEWDYAPASRTATKLNRLYFNGACRSWSHIPLSARNQMFERFQQYYTWDLEMDSQIRQIWERKCGKSYNDNLSSARSRAARKKRRSGTDNTSSESGEYVTSQCSRVAGGYRTGVVGRYNDDPVNHLPLDTQLWHELTGGTKKGRSFGFGYYPDPNAILGGSSSSGGASSSQQQIIENLMTQVQELKQQVEERRAEEERRREEYARFRKQYEEMCELVKSLSQNVSRPPP